MYEGLWQRIMAADHSVVVVCSAGYAPRLIQAVKKEKTGYNKRRQELDLPQYGRLIVKQSRIDDGRIRIEFSLQYNGDKL